MCGISGFYSKTKSSIEGINILTEMISTLIHRGPDEYGVYVNGNMGLAQARLSIIDLEGGSQPIHNEDKSVWIVFNGEIFNYLELRQQLEKKGHIFYTKTDTEVLIHLYEEDGIGMLDKLNGQFAFTIYDIRRKQFFIARDHVGIIPLYYTLTPGGEFVFSSEIKGLFQFPGVTKHIDHQHLMELFVFWSNLNGKTIFRDVHELMPGHYMIFNGDQIHIGKYWDLTFPANADFEYKSTGVYENELRELLDDASAIRLRADVPVAAYLSGGIDSSIVAYLIKKFHQNELTTFSVGFQDPRYDERSYQQMMVNFLGTNHFETVVSGEDIAGAFSQLIWYTEKPTFRSAPAPLYYLSKLVRENHIKVVLTGEGADENFAGYNIFKEAKIREFLARNPNSAQRELLLNSIYPYVKRDERTQRFWKAFFKRNLEQVHKVYFSHMLRWANSSYVLQFMKKEIRDGFNPDEKMGEIESFFPEEARNWNALNRAQYLEIKLFLPGYLLSTQGDRMLMANSVEGRFPYLDRRVMEFAARMPNYLKMPGLKEKNILKRTFRNELPHEILYRDKQPYRAPIYTSFLGENAPDFVRYYLSEEALAKTGIFEPETVRKLVSVGTKRGLNEKEEMALMNIISTQALIDQFFWSFENKKNQKRPLVKIYQ
jgi:asparagine synthase (glutamine-hydrolysing)